MIRFSHKGDFAKTTKFFKSVAHGNYLKGLEKYGDKGVQALMEATPVDTGLTAHSWGYKVTATDTSYVITWTNSNQNDGVPIAIILQYGHGTRNGGYVQGRDYINPALRPIFDEIAEAAWNEVVKA